MLMRKLILIIHAYLGLLCVPYLLIFGVSSLNVNHNFFEKNKSILRNSWIQQIEVPEELRTEDLGNALADSLDLFGWYIPWESYSNNSKHHIKISHFGKEYVFEKFRDDNQVRIQEYSRGTGDILFGLHALGGGVPKAPFWINIWKYYQDLTVYASLFWAITGVYMWAGKRERSTTSLWVLLVFSSLSLILMGYLWLVG